MPASIRSSYAARPAVRTNSLSMCEPGHEDAQLHAALRGLDERVLERRAGHEVGGRELDRALRRREREVDERLRVRVADRRARAHHLHRAAVLDPLDVREVAVAGEHVAGALEPVLREGTLEPAHDGPAHPDVRVAPVVRVLGVAGPLLGDAHAAREADGAVHDQELPVRAVLEPLHRVRLGRAEEAHLHARVAHLAHELAVHPRRADGVEDHVALDPVARLLTERVRHLGGDVAAPVGVGEEVHRLLGPANRLEVRGEDLVAVDEDVRVVAVRHRRAGQCLGRAEERVVANVHVASQRVAVTALAPVAQAVGGVPRRSGSAHAGGPGVAGHMALPPAEPPCSHRAQAIRAGACVATRPRSAPRARPRPAGRAPGR